MDFAKSLRCSIAQNGDSHAETDILVDGTNPSLNRCRIPVKPNQTANSPYASKAIAKHGKQIIDTPGRAGNDEGKDRKSHLAKDWICHLHDSSLTESSGRHHAAIVFTPCFGKHF
jgi:hypothetical protein